MAEKQSDWIDFQETFCCVSEDGLFFEGDDSLDGLQFDGASSSKEPSDHLNLDQTTRGLSKRVQHNFQIVKKRSQYKKLPAEKTEGTRSPEKEGLFKVQSALRKMVRVRPKDPVELWPWTDFVLCYTSQSWDFDLQDKLRKAVLKDQKEKVDYKILKAYDRYLLVQFYNSELASDFIDRVEQACRTSVLDDTRVQYPLVVNQPRLFFGVNSENPSEDALKLTPFFKEHTEKCTYIMFFEEKPSERGEAPTEEKPSERGEAPTEEKPSERGEAPTEEKPSERGEAPIEEKPSERGEVPTVDIPKLSLFLSFSDHTKARKAAGKLDNAIQVSFDRFVLQLPNEITPNLPTIGVRITPLPNIFASGTDPKYLILVFVQECIYAMVKFYQKLLDNKGFQINSVNVKVKRGDEERTVTGSVCTVGLTQKSDLVLLSLNSGKESSECPSPRPLPEGYVPSTFLCVQRRPHYPENWPKPASNGWSEMFMDPEGNPIRVFDIVEPGNLIPDQ